MNKQFFINKIQNNFPDLKFKKSKIIDYGWNKTVIILDNKIVFSFPKNKEAKTKFKSELMISPILSKKITLAIPTLQFIPTDKSFAGYNFVSGIPLTLNEFNKFNTHQQNLAAKQLSNFLNQLHSISVSIAKNNEVTSAWSEIDARNYYENQAKIVYKNLSKNDCEILKHLWKTYCTSKITNNYKKTVIHQDFTSDHILFDKKTKRISGIIDFGDIQIGDPAIDFRSLWEYGENFVDKVLKGYKFNYTSLKSRTYRLYIYQCIGNMYCGITMKRKDYWQKGYGLIKLYKKL